MKILFVSQYYWPEQFRGNDIVKGLIEKGHEVTVLTGLPNYPKGKLYEGYSISGPYYENLEGAEVYRVPLIPRGKNKSLMLALNYFSFFISASLLGPFKLRGKKIDRIFIYGLSPATLTIPGIVMKFFKKAPVTYWVTDLWPETLIATGAISTRWSIWLWGKFMEVIYSFCDQILVSSKGFIPLINKKGVPIDRITYWPQWGEELFTQTNIPPEDLPSHEVPKGFKVMFAGNIGTSQAFETIIEAATFLKNKKEIKWVILGDGLMRQWVQSEVQKRGLQDTFFLLGSRPIDTMPSYYALSDVLLASLKKDPLFAITVPAKIQSYLPSSKPIMASMDGEGAEIITNSNAGLASEASNSKALADAITKLYDKTPNEREQMGLRAKKLFFENFERSKLLNELDTLLSIKYK